MSETNQNSICRFERLQPELLHVALLSGFWRRIIIYAKATKISVTFRISEVKGEFLNILEQILPWSRIGWTLAYFEGGK